MLYCNFDTIITGLYQQTNTNMHIKRLFDCDELYKHITTSTANDDNEFKIKENHLFFFHFEFINNFLQLMMKYACITYYNQTIV